MKDCNTCKFLETSVWKYPCMDCKEFSMYLDNDASIDPIVEAVRSKLLSRSQVGLTKYGVGLDRTDLTKLQWLTHLQEELMDACCYGEVLLQLELQKSLENSNGTQEKTNCNRD
jgi:hypothetical protein